MNFKLTGPLGLALLATSLHAQSVSTVISTGLYEPHALAVDAQNNVYICDGGKGNRILKYSSDKALSVLAGRQGTFGYTDGVGDAATFNDPHGIVYARGGLFVADYNNHVIRFVNATSGAVTTIAGQYDANGYGGFADGAAGVAQFSLPAGLAVDSQGNVYVADFGNDAVRKIDLSNNVTTIATGFGGGGFGGPDALALADDTHIYVADAVNNVIKRITIVSGVSTNVDVVAGTGVSGYKNSTYSLSAQFNQPRGILYVGGLTGLLVADTGNNYLRNLYYNTNTLSLGVTSITNGFNEPLGLAVDLEGNILVADSKTATVLSYSPGSQPTPTITPASGSYSNAVTVTFGTTLDAVYPQTFRYTTDGSTVKPTSSAASSIVLNGTNGFAYVPVQVRSYAPDLLVSALASNSYSFYVANPVITPATATTQTNALTVTLSSDTQGASLRFTTNGVEPTESSPLYTTNGIVINGNCVLLVKGFKNGYASSAIVTNTYFFAAANPVVTPDGISTNNSVTVSMSCGTTNASIYWTIDGTTPSATNGTLYTGPFTLSQYGSLTAIAVKTNYTASSTVVAAFNLTASDPVISPAGLTNSMISTVTLTCATPGAVIYYTFDDTLPTTNSASCLSGATISVVNGTLRALAYRNGFWSSGVTVVSIDLAVGTPVITPNGATNDNPVVVSITNASNYGDFYYTLDGTEPTVNSQHYAVPFVLETNATLKVIGVASGFASSAVVSAPFSLGVGALQVSPDSQTTVNTNSVTISCSTTNAVILYTLDGTTPGTSSTTLKYTNVNPAVKLTLPIPTNTVLNAVASYKGFIDAASVTKTYTVQVDTPTMSPSQGYFPSGSWVTFTVVRPDASVYYTTDGTDPTTNSTLYTGAFLIDQISFPKTDLRTIKAAAFAPNTMGSAIVSGSSLATNSVGVPAAVNAGAGATIVVPVVVNMASSTTSVRSIQFRLEVTPTSGASNLVNDLEALSLSANDFVPVAGNSSDGYSAVVNSSTYRTTNSGVVTFGIEFHSIATNLLIESFGVVSNVKIKVPSTAKNGSVYNIKVLQVSGTSDAYQGKLILTNLPDVTLTVKSIAYLAGDVTTGSWYNAGDFGDKNLDNADVNAVFQASLGVHTPYAGTDSYNAMDVYPETRAVIGDGLITYLDWQHVLRRSLRLETNNWIRFWTNGVLSHTATANPTLASRAAAPRLTQATTASSTEWLRQAMLVVGTVTNAEPGTTYSLPVYLKVLPGFSVAGLQFRAALAAQGSAPEAGVVQFSQAANMQAPLQYHLLPATNQASCAWSIDSFDTPLTGSNLLGYLSFKVPVTAQAGQVYQMQLLCPGGAKDWDTEVSLETVSGALYVKSAPASMPQHLVSDEWKTNYFGSLTSTNADPMADPDHDGVPNWMEFLAGTNPTNAASHLQFSGLQWVNASNLFLQWDVVAGRQYVIEKATAVGGKWTPIQTNTINESVIGANIKADGNSSSQFYRLRLLEP